jgi:hypothetical protein
VEASLIDAYVVALHARLRWRPDVDDVLDEVTDHLRERADRLVAQGMPLAQAEQDALESFGQLGQVVRSFAVTDSGGLAVPSRLTRLAGVTALAAGIAWTVSILAAVTGGHMDVFVPWSLSRYHVWVAVLMAAMGFTTLTLAGVLLRIGRLRTLRGGGLVVVGTALVPALTVFGWAVTIISTTLSLSVLAALHGSEPALSRFVRPSRVLTVWLLGGASLFVLDEVLRVGPVDEYGDHPWAWLIPYLVCTLCSAAALAVLGARLWTERPAVLDEQPGPPGTPTSA